MRPSSGAIPWDEDLNDAQREAAAYSGGPLAVLAGPGSGKTRVIIHRVARLLDDGVEPEKILCLAFNIKAAEELRQRLYAMVGAQAERVRAHTCHAFGRSIVRRFGDMLGLPPEPQIMDSAQRKRLLRELIRTNRLFRERASEGSDVVVAEAAEFVSKCRDRAVSAKRCAAWIAAREKALKSGDHGMDEVALARERAVLPLERQMAELFGHYEKAIIERGLITLDDYLWLPLRLLDEKDLPASILRDESRHIVVDEFQDWNTTQIELLARLAPAKVNPDLCVVGDDDQAIYGFRGADDRAFQRFRDHYANHHQVELTVNYRSAPAIIDAANAVIRKAESRFAPDKSIQPHDATRIGTVEGVTVEDDGALGTTIAAMILADRRDRAKSTWRDYAVLVRTNGMLDTIARELEAHDIPVSVRERPSPLDDAAVQDLVAWMTLLTSPGDRPSMQRILVRPPFLVHPEVVGEWGSAHLAAQKAGDERPFHEWLRREHSGTNAALARCLEIYDGFVKHSATHHAGHTVDHIVRTLSLPHVETLPAREHARRIADIVQVMRFVADRVERLEAPGDLAAFMKYRADLDEFEEKFVGAGDERVDRSADEDDPDVDAVRVLTAHTAKGLEFDTVFVPRVRPPHGYPQTSMGSRNEGELPPALTGAAPASAADEERRLFYVACTRAQRRLVLLAKHKKSLTTSSVDYFLELTHDAPELGVAVKDAMEWIERAGVALPKDELDAGDEGGISADRLERAAQQARQDAAAALFELERADQTDDQLHAVLERMSEAGRRLAAVAHLRAMKKEPGRERTPSDQLAAIIARLHREEPAAPLTRPLKAPLRLSFSAIKEYESCARCYYVKYVMGLDEPKTFALAAGDIAHKSLERWLNWVRAVEAEQGEQPGGDASRAKLLAIGAETLKAAIERNVPVEPDIEERIEGMLGHAFEMHDPAAMVHGVEEFFEIPYERAGARHRVVGKIDRIEQLADNTWRLVDYKTGRPADYLTAPKKDDLQMSLYALALPHVLKLATPEDPNPECPEGAAEYWVISTGDRGVIALSALKLNKARQKIDATIDGMLGGKFEKGKGCKGLCGVLGE